MRRRLSEKKKEQNWNDVDVLEKNVGGPRRKGRKKKNVVQDYMRGEYDDEYDDLDLDYDVVDEYYDLDYDLDYDETLYD